MADFLVAITHFRTSELRRFGITSLARAPPRIPRKLLSRSRNFWNWDLGEEEKEEEEKVSPPRWWWLPILVVVPIPKKSSSTVGGAADDLDMFGLFEKWSRSWSERLKWRRREEMLCGAIVRLVVTGTRIKRSTRFMKMGGGSERDRVVCFVVSVFWVPSFYCFMGTRLPRGGNWSN